jgi:hypothetical protein
LGLAKQDRLAPAAVVGLPPHGPRQEFSEPPSSDESPPRSPIVVASTSAPTD